MVQNQKLQQGTDMEAENVENPATMAERLSSENNKKRNLIISIAAGLVFLVALAAVLAASAKHLPELINQPFDNSNAASSFTTAGNGTWQVLNGTYQLSKPAALTNPTAGNANLSINTTALTQNEWILNTDAKALSSGSNGSHDFSIIFDYTDDANYYYANFSDKTDADANGIFRVKAGTQTRLLAFNDTITADANNQVEIRKKNGEVKVFLDGGSKYEGKVEAAQYASSRIGFGSRGGAALFDNLVVTGQGTISNPDPKPTPEPPTSTPPSHTGDNGNAGAGTIVTTPNGRIITVTNSEQLAAALRDARAGDDIKLADGTYTGKSPVCSHNDKNAPAKVVTDPCSYQKIGTKTVLAYDSTHEPVPSSVKVYTGSFATPKLDSSRAATADKPIVIEGSRKAVIDGGGTGGHYGLYLVDAAYWQVKGLTIANAAKGLVMDRSSHVFIDGVEVTSVGQEAVHFRDFSDHGTIQNSFVHKTGQKNAAYGEGVYIGSANSNWASYSGGVPDESNYVLVQNNKITDIAAEGLDIKEGTKYGVVRGNYFDGSSVAGKNSADSWIDVKGNNYVIDGNTGVNPPNASGTKSALLDGFQVHNVYTGWGANNVFTNNIANVDAKGYGFMIGNGAQGNTVNCNNKQTGAGAGLANVKCTQ